MIYFSGYVLSKCWAQEIDTLSCCSFESVLVWNSYIEYINLSKSGETGRANSYSAVNYIAFSTIELNEDRERYIQDILE